MLWISPDQVLDEMATTDMEGVTLGFAKYLDWNFTLTAVAILLFREAVYVTLGEELLFRGLIGGILFRRFGFHTGNLLQTAIFVLPHLLILVLVPGLWPMIVVWAAAGWLMGWLYFRTGSIVPGWIAHTLGNVLATLQMVLIFF
ncbi:CPBP family intramembrane glutamic endopeptidase [Halorubrum vacuolatum]|nr:CPBP family intramembrane glutamic endopeptidase [Halorubrum vacuolatum]